MHEFFLGQLAGAHGGGIVLHAFEGKIVPFSPQTLKEIEQFKALYGMTLKASDSHNLKERKR